MRRLLDRTQSALWCGGESHVGSSPFASRANPTRRTRERPRCRPHDAPLTGDALLAAVTDAMVALHERYHHRAPVTAKTLMLGDDLLACVLGGVYTDVEKTMIELQRATDRPGDPQRLPERDAAQVHRGGRSASSGRGVLAFISNHHVGPDMEIELFMLKPAQLIAG